MSQPSMDYQSPPPPHRTPPRGTIQLFTAFGIPVYVHWAWLVVAVFEIQNRKELYSSVAWNIAEYLSLFAIVLIHEFGHALACLSVGGRADRILLWPLGGVAFVQPPRRPGAVLWSIAAGPLVNVILLPITYFVFTYVRASGAGGPDLLHFLRALVMINGALLLFNMLPIYPLDGGQILQAILWFFIGERRSLMTASIIGLAGSAAGLFLAVMMQSIWLIVVAVFAALQCWGAFKRAKMLGESESQITLRGNAKCPSCGVPPPVGPFWGCPCGKQFDVFESRGVCPNCGGAFMVVPCPSCRQPSIPAAWFAQANPRPALD